MPYSNIKKPLSIRISPPFWTVHWAELPALYSRFSLAIYFILESQCGLPWWLSGKESACQSRKHGFDPWVRKILWRGKWQPTLVFLPGNGQRAAVYRVAKSQTRLSD